MKSRTEHYVAIANQSFVLLRRRWFTDLNLDPDAQMPVTRLLLWLYSAERLGRRTYKKDASAAMSTVDGRTRERYIEIARKAGLLTVSKRVTADRRSDALHPTIKLQQLVEKELKRITY